MTFHNPNFEDKGRIHAYHNGIKAEPFRGNPSQARLSEVAIDRDPAIIDLAYLFAGLVTIAQPRLVHCILQGVEHTDPTEWSNSHLSNEDNL